VKLAARREVDAEDRQPIESWYDNVISAVQSVNIDTRIDYLSPIIADAGDDDDLVSGPSRERPHRATLLVCLCDG